MAVMFFDPLTTCCTPDYPDPPREIENMVKIFPLLSFRSQSQIIRGVDALSVALFVTLDKICIF